MTIWLLSDNRRIEAMAKGGSKEVAKAQARKIFERIEAMSTLSIEDKEGQWQQFKEELE